MTASAFSSTGSVATYRVGLIVPSTNTQVEPLAGEVVRQLPDTALHVTRLRVLDVSIAVDSTHQFSSDAFSPAARLLADARPHTIAWAGTSGAWLGLETERETLHLLSAAAGVAATTSTRAVVAACRSFGIDSIGLLTPYTPEIVGAVVASFAELGIAVRDEQHLGISDSYACGEVPLSIFESHAAKLASARAEAMVVLCTNFSFGTAVDSVEKRLGIPVLDSITATLWHSCATSGRWQALSGFGQLWASTAPEPVATTEWEACGSPQVAAAPTAVEAS